MIFKYTLIKFLVFVNVFLNVNSLCNVNVKSVCDCQQSTIDNQTSIQCPKTYAGSRYTHFIEIVDQHRIKINCITFNPLNEIPKLYLGRPHVTRIEFINCFNNRTRHLNYQFDFEQFMNKTLDAYDRNWNSIDVSFHDSAKVNETLFFSRWPLSRSKVTLRNIYTQTSDYLPDLYGAEYVCLINLNLVDFNKFLDSDHVIILEIINTKTVKNLNKHNLSKFKRLLYFTIKNSAIHDYGQIFMEGSIFEKMPAIKEISLISTFNECTEKIELNATVFYYLNRLISLKLIDLKLDELPSMIFNDLEELSYLVMRHNRLSSLDRNIFANCQKLVKIDLAYNNFVRIDTTVFSQLTALAVLNLSHNQLKSFLYDASNHTNFKEIYLNYNHIQMDSFTCPIINIQHSAGVIDYSYNQISESEPILDCLIKNPELRELKVQHNQIQSLRFSKKISNQTLYKSHITLDLQSNLIDYIDLLEYQDMGTSEDEKINMVLLLDSNPIFCHNCQNSNALFANGTDTILVYHNTVIRIPQPEICIKSIFCPINNFVPHYSCPDPCYCTFNKHFSSLAINCENKALAEIPFLSNDLLYGITINEIHLNLQGNRIANISFDKSMRGNQTSFDVIRKITKINLEHNSIETLNLHHDHFPISLKTLKLAWNKISNMDDTTIVLMNTRESLLSVSLGNNPITKDNQLYDHLINRIKFILVDRESIDQDFNNRKLETQIRESQSSTVSIVVVSLVFVLVIIGLSYTGYVFQRNHTKYIKEIQIQQAQTELGVEPVSELSNVILSTPQVN